MRVSEKWIVWKFIKVGEQINRKPYVLGVEPSVAKSIARSKNKNIEKPSNVLYYAEEEPRRWV